MNYTHGPWFQGTNLLMIESEKGIRVCEITGSISNESSLADACLVSAAPELLEALQRARNGLEWYIDMCPDYADDSDSETLEIIDKAIKKATQ